MTDSDGVSPIIRETGFKPIWDAPKVVPKIVSPADVLAGRLENQSVQVTGKMRSPDENASPTQSLTSKPMAPGYRLSHR